MRSVILGLSAATMLSGVASAATFDFSTGVNSEQPNSVTSLTLSDGGTNFTLGVSALFGNGGTANALLWDAADPGGQFPNDVVDRDADPDLVFKGYDTDFSGSQLSGGVELNQTQLDSLVFGGIDSANAPATNRVLVIGNSNGDIVDDQVGGSLTFTNLSDGTVTINQMAFMDDVKATITTSADNITREILINGPGSNGSSCGSTNVKGDNCLGGLQFLEPILLAMNDTLTVSLDGSGGISGFDASFDPNITTPVPLPGALPLLLAGMGGLALVGRRRKG